MKKTFDIWNENCERLYALRKKGTSFLFHTYQEDSDYLGEEGENYISLYYDTLKYARFYDTFTEAKKVLDFYHNPELEIVELSIIIEVVE